MKDDTKIMILKFLLNGEEFGLKVSDVEEVNRLPKVMPIRGTDESILGLINLHGKTAPVIVLNKAAKMISEQEQGELFITLKTDNGPLCLLIDELTGFEKISREDISDPVDMSLKLDTKYLEFVYLSEGSMFSVLDVNSISNRGHCK